jgi:hypothetical protein
VDDADGRGRLRVTIVPMTDDEKPLLLPPEQMPAVRTQADLRNTWRALLGDLNHSDRRVWLLFLDRDGQPSGPLLTIDDLPDGPYDLPVDDLVTVCREILDGPGGGGSVALLVSRPGRDPWHVGDRAWGRYLTAAAHRIGGQVWPVHRANARELTAVPADGAGGRDTA